MRKRRRGSVRRGGGGLVASTFYKPAGIPVFPLREQPDADCVLRRLLDAEPWRSGREWPPGFEGGLTHRLDTSTSGALLVADDPEELDRIRQAFTEKRWLKTYRLLASRNPPWDENRCERAIGHDLRHKGRMVVQRGRETPHRGRWYEAETSFRRLHGTLFEAQMRTGVMHQIRVHAAFLGIPLLGDARYGGGKTPTHADTGVSFFLHHVGMLGPNGWATTPVATPAWASTEI
jgi:23S rRNA-/tRNA-specific pseudouridylate synthase